jgi:hypothetical protein
VAAINRRVYIIQRKLNNGEMWSRYYGKENSCAVSPRYRQHNLNRREKVDIFSRPRFYDKTSWSETSLNNTVRHTITGSVFANNQYDISDKRSSNISGINKFKYSMDLCDKCREILCKCNSVSLLESNFYLDPYLVKNHDNYNVITVNINELQSSYPYTVIRSIVNVNVFLIFFEVKLFVKKKFNMYSILRIISIISNDRIVHKYPQIILIVVEMLSFSPSFTCR